MNPLPEQLRICRNGDTVHTVVQKKKTVITVYVLKMNKYKIQLAVFDFLLIIFICEIFYLAYTIHSHPHG